MIIIILFSHDCVYLILDISVKNMILDIIYLLRQVSTFTSHVLEIGDILHKIVNHKVSTFLINIDALYHYIFITI